MFYDPIGLVPELFGGDLSHIPWIERATESIQGKFSDSLATIGQVEPFTECAEIRIR